ncbi:MAG: hypothetical protein Q9187_001953 [Circinaria calcarea]
MQTHGMAHSHNASLGVQYQRSTTPLPLQNDSQAYQQTVHHQHDPALMADWHMTPLGLSTQYALDTSAFPQQTYETYGMPFQTSPTDYIAPPTSLQGSMDANLEASLDASLQLDGSYLALSNPLAAMPFTWQDFQENLGFPGQQVHGLPDLSSAHQTIPENSPSDNYLEVRSLTSTSSDNGWAAIDYVPLSPHAIFNPEQTLHPRTFSDSSYSDLEQHSRTWESYVDVSNAVTSPETDSAGEYDFYQDPNRRFDAERPSPPAVVTTAMVQPIAIRQTPSPQHSSASTSPIARRHSRKNSIMKPTKAIARRPSQSVKADTEKRVGRRRGPLKPDQRRQAGEIRKLGACLRCRFLKKTCDKGEPCIGCQPSHARLWVVPCTRIDIKDIGYFMKDWKADYERHVSLGFSIGNIKGFSDQERTLFVTHGYGHMLPVKAREVYVRDERCFGVSWIETINQETPKEHEIDTARLSAGVDGISSEILSSYLDRHIDEGFVNFVDDFFEGTPFITEILKTTYKYWQKEKTPVIREALKLVLAYNLTQHVTMVATIPGQEPLVGQVQDENSKWNGHTVAPVMINFQVKCAMADMWRDLQKSILEQLSHLYSSVYSKDKLKHWPTIFMLATILLVVWETMQFDCRYKVPDAAVVEKFCTDMETTPVGVIVGLFSAISQKLPAFGEWDTRKHQQLLGNNAAVCAAMTEVRDHVTRHG